MILLLASITIILNLYSQQPTECAHTSTQFSCVNYLKNYDGDTITFDIADIHPLLGKKISVRVKGLDTPEVRTKDNCEKTAARTARKLVENLLKNAKRIDLKNIERDKYFRILADVQFDGKNLAEILLSNKLAYTYNGGKKEKINWCDYGRVPANKN